MLGMPEKVLEVKLEQKCYANVDIEVKTLEMLRQARRVGGVKSDSYKNVPKIESASLELEVLQQRYKSCEML